MRLHGNAALSWSGRRRLAERVVVEGWKLTAAAEIAELLGMALSTVSGILARQGMGRLGRLGLEQPHRYERSRPGELVHIDGKRLGRIEGGAGNRAFGSERRSRRTN